MENQTNSAEQEQFWENWEKNHRRGKMIGGFFVVLFGALYLAKELGAFIPDWIFSWKMLFIGIGLIIGIKCMFRNWTWLVFVFVGSAFLISDFYPGLNITPFIWPVIIILIGMTMIFRPKRKFDPNKWDRWQRFHGYKMNPAHWDKSYTSSTEDHIDSTSFMGSVKKNIISKDFKGGEITNIFGGAEYNLSQADFKDNVTLEITQVFGGTRLIIPSNWEIKSELIAVFGGIEDKRPIQANITNAENKILILKGTTFFGGIDIRSYN